jgi:hypothetical protein
MKNIAAGLLGAVLGSSITLMAVAAYEASREPQPLAAEQIHAGVSTPKVSPSYEATGRTFKDAVDICVRLGVSRVGCIGYHYPGQKMNGELDVGTATVSGHLARISRYDTSAEVNNFLNHQNGRDEFGSRVDTVAGSNWTVTIVIADGEGHKTAKDVQVVLGGIVVLSGQG